MTSRAFEALDRVLAKGGEPDDVLRSVVATLVDELGIAWAGIGFLEEGKLTLGPEAGAPDELRRVRVPVIYQGDQVGELWADGEVEQSLLAQVAALISAHVLIGWDTRGEDWDP